jgi:hypothetical protein
MGGRMAGIRCAIQFVTHVKPRGLIVRTDLWPAHSKVWAASTQAWSTVVIRCLRSRDIRSNTRREDSPGCHRAAFGSINGYLDFDNGRDGTSIWRRRWPPQERPLPVGTERNSLHRVGQIRANTRIDQTRLRRSRVRSMLIRPYALRRDRSGRCRAYAGPDGGRRAGTHREFPT